MDYIEIEGRDFVVSGVRFAISTNYKVDGRRVLLEKSHIEPIDNRIHLISELIILVAWVLWRIWIMVGDEVTKGGIKYVHHDIDRRIYKGYEEFGIMCLVRDIVGTKAEIWVSGRWIPMASWWLWERAQRSVIVQRLLRERRRWDRGSVVIDMETCYMGEDEYGAMIERIKGECRNWTGSRAVIRIVDMGADIVRIAMISNIEEAKYEAIKNILALK
jgi:hypothetical protein